MLGWIILLAAAAVGIYIIVVFNRLVRTRQMANEAWSGIDVQLKRRSDLVPNLVETVKGYAAHERSVLEEVTELRGQARSLPADDVARRAQAEGALSLALGKLFALAENYPDLKASGNFLELQRQLSDLENEIQMARRYYNGAVRNLNVMVQSFPRQPDRRRVRVRAAAIFRNLGRSRARRAPGDAAAGATMMRPKIINARWRRNAALPLMLALAVWLFATAGAFAAEVIYSFDSDVTLAKDGELTVTEVIARAARKGAQIRHGIYRDFPLTFKDAGGTLREVDFSLLSVTRDGRPEPYFTKRIRSFLRIYAGDEEQFVTRGEHTYVFHYRTAPAGALVRRQAGAQLERHRQFLALPDRGGDLSPASRRRRGAAALDRLYRPPGRARRRVWQRIRQRFGVLTVATTQRLAPRRGADRRCRLCPQPRSRRRARTTCCGTNCSTTAAGFWAGSASCWCSVITSPPGTRSAAIPRAAPSFRCFIRRRAFAGARQLHPRLGLRARKVARLHRRRAVAGGARPHPLR